MFIMKPSLALFVDFVALVKYGFWKLCLVAPMILVENKMEKHH